MKRRTEKKIIQKESLFLGLNPNNFIVIVSTFSRERRPFSSKNLFVFCLCYSADAPKPVSAFDKFKQLDSANSSNR